MPITSYPSAVETMSKDERSLLLFLETCAVDRGGKVDIRHMNEVDIAISNEWTSTAFVKFGPIYSEDFKESRYSYYVLLSSDAHELSAKLRVDRANRMWSKRKYRTATDCFREL